MPRSRLVGVASVVCLLATLSCGCFSSSTPTAPPPATTTYLPEPALPADASTAEPTTAAAPKGTAPAAGKSWDDYPDVPFVDIMTEVDGIQIPRLKSASQSLQLTGAIPADVGNKHAQESPGEKVTGDWVTIRFDSEPKILNNLIETSAVCQYLATHFNEALARQDLETFKYEPHIASKWILEDSVKLSPDYPGKERRIALEGGQPAAALEIEYTLPAKDGDKTPEPPKVDVSTFDKDGKPLGNVWVGVFPVGRIVGAPVSGYHLWSDAAGKVSLGGMPTGKYTVKVGAEIYGTAAAGDDKSLTVTASTPENPLNEELKSSAAPALTLKPGEWIDVQYQTYYTFYLRDDVKWSDGHPFTTVDLEFAYAIFNNPTADVDSLRTYYTDLIECKALSPLVVRMRYRQQYFKAFEFTAGLAAYSPPLHVFREYFKAEGKELTLEKLTPEQEAQQKKVSVHGAEFGKFFNIDPRYNRQPLGTGPYTVDKWERGDRVELARNPNYWLPERAGHLDKIIAKFIPDNVTALQALKAGEIDFLWRMTPDQFFVDLQGPPDWFQGKYVKASWFAPMFAYIGYNILKPEFQDRRVRIALSMLFDKNDFLEKKLYNEAVIVTGTQYFFGPGYDHEVAPLAYNPEVARDLLAEAGWVDTDGDGILDKDGRSMKFVLPMPKGNAVAEERVQLFQKNLKSVGIQLEIQFQEWASFIDKLRAKDYDICTLSWATSIEADPYQIWHSSGAGKESRGSNHVSFADPLGDELIEMLRLTLDEKKRKRIHQSFHRLLDREQPNMFLYCVKDFGCYHQRFRGVKWYRLRPGFDLTEWWVPKSEQIH